MCGKLTVAAGSSTGQAPLHRRDVVRRRGDFSGRSFGLPKYRAPGACSPGPRSGRCGKRPAGRARSWRGRFRGGRITWLQTVTVERIDGGKLRCTGATWTDAVVIFPGEVLAFQNIERQAHALRAPSPGEDDLEGGRMTGHFTWCGACGRSHSLPGGKLDVAASGSSRVRTILRLLPTRGGRHPPIW